MRVLYLFFFLLTITTFSQTKKLDLKIDAITYNDSLRGERKFTIKYHIENLTDTAVSFFLEENKLMPAHNGSMLPIMLYKLYQENEVLQVNSILNQYSKNDNTDPLQFLSIKDENKRDIAIEKYFKALKKEAVTDSVANLNSSKKLMNSFYKLNPKESKKYSHTFYWDKTRYFKEDDLEYLLEENSKINIEFYLILMKEEFKTSLTANDFKKIMEDKTFIQGVFISNKMGIDFKQ